MALFSSSGMGDMESWFVPHACFDGEVQIKLVLRGALHLASLRVVQWCHGVDVIALV